MNLKPLFLSEIRSEIKAAATSAPGVFTEEDLQDLPTPVQKYFRHCNYIGKERSVNAFIKWKNTFLRLSPEKPWMGIQCEQFNSAPRPCRIVYMKSKIMGLFPFEGRDTFREGRGNMLIYLVKFIKIQDAKGFEMDTSALVTVLSESLLLPVCALQKYITWTAIDDLHARADIEFNGIRAGGIFTFNDSGEFTRFETEDRFQSQKDGSSIKMKWFVTAERYSRFGEIIFPAYLTANWVTENGDYQYFKGEIDSIEHNISGSEL